MPNRRANYSQILNALKQGRLWWFFNRRYYKLRKNGHIRAVVFDEENVRFAIPFKTGWIRKFNGIVCDFDFVQIGLDPPSDFEYDETELFIYSGDPNKYHEVQDWRRNIAKKADINRAKRMNSGK